MLEPLKQLAKVTLTQLTALAGPQNHSFSTSEKLWILMYHRILPQNDPRYAQEEPGMVVTPQTFDSHLHTLKQKFSILPLQTWIEKKANGLPVPKKACAITFDDGWQDNYEYAWPILRDHNIPATIFLVSDMIGTPLRFWPNRVAHLMNMHIQHLREHHQSDWFGNAIHSPVSRESISRCIAHLKQYQDTAIEQKLDALEAGLNLNIAQADLMTWQQVQTLQESGLIDFGCHTSNHRRLLTYLSNEELRQQILLSQQLLKNKLSRPVPLFCYPNGDYSSAAKNQVGNIFSAAVTTQRGINSSDTNLLELKRIGIHEDVSNSRTKFLARLSAWI